VLPKHILEMDAVDDATPVVTQTTDEAARAMGEEDPHDLEKRG